MTERQFAQMLCNRRLRGAQPALDAGLAADIIGRAAAARRRVAAAEAVLARLATPEWVERIEVVSLDEGVLTLATADWALCSRLRAARLGRDLQRAAPGVRSVRIVVRGANQELTDPHE